MREGTTPSPRIAAGAEVSADSFIGPFVSIGEGCVIEAGARIENSILWEDVRVKNNCFVRNCIIGSGVTINRNCSDTVITRNGEAPIV